MGEREAGRQACSPGLLNVLEEQTRNRRKTRISPRAGAKPAHRGRETARAPGAPHTPREPLTHSPPPPTHTQAAPHTQREPLTDPLTHIHTGTPHPRSPTPSHTPPNAHRLPTPSLPLTGSPSRPHREPLRRSPAGPPAGPLADTPPANAPYSLSPFVGHRQSAAKTSRNPQTTARDPPPAPDFIPLFLIGQNPPFRKQNKTKKSKIVRFFSLPRPLKITKEAKGGREAGQDK